LSAEKKLSGVEWSSVSDKTERHLGQRLRISHAKVPHSFLADRTITQYDQL